MSLLCRGSVLRSLRALRYPLQRKSHQIFSCSRPILFSQLLRRVFSSQPTPATQKQLSESFISGTSANYIEETFEAWKKDPNSVHKSWDIYFRGVERGARPGDAHALPPSISSGAAIEFSKSSAIEGDVKSAVRDALRLNLLVRAFQVRGHLVANVDPLELDKKDTPPELTLEYYGFTEKDLDREILVSGSPLSGFLTENRDVVTLRSIYQRLKETYTGTIGVEFMHIQDREECNWIRNRVETPTKYQYDKDTRLNILDRLGWADAWERFLAVKHAGTKRFGLDGCEVLIPGMKHLIDHSSTLGVDSVVIGMAHRGRLNVLANVVRKPLVAIFSEFSGKVSEDDSFSGDVKYHLGLSNDRPTRSGKLVHLTLVANPSHLEAVNPVVEGKARAKQYYKKDAERSQVLPLLIHGDAAFAGQGVVSETLDLSGLANYTTGGTVHLILNNQIGFTTDPKDSRSSPYCTDVAKMISAPIFHVNGNDVEAVMHCMELAAEWRAKFKRDVVVDIICYRKYGHNEIDPPDFTQPLMYKKIAQMRPTLDIYEEKLLSEGVATKAQIQEIRDNIQNNLNREFENSKNYKPPQGEWLDGQWRGFLSPKQLSVIQQTGVPTETLQKVGKALYHVPEGFKLHKNLVRILKQKEQMFITGKGLDWATAEALAFGTLLLEGIHVRLSGQDVERGTFSHRHSVLHDQESNDRYVPLNNICSKQEYFEATNSSLSEFAVLGFELGYSLENPNSLVLWEAQFGDFANGAQVIIDTFLSCGEQKWQRQSGLVLLLPHGYEGQGPEHSSARLERFLQLSDSNPSDIPTMERASRKQIQQSNWQVVNVTTPANYFHVLRRQIRRDFRKPLIVMSPKSLLRHPLATSNLDEFDNQGEDDTRFKRLIPEIEPELLNQPDSIERLIFCSGKVYYDLLTERRKRAIKNTAIVRVEQISPFPFDRVQEQAKLYNKAKVIWAQEEPQNMGSWHFVFFHFRTAIPNRELSYAGREPSAASATGTYKQHEQQLKRLLDDAFNK